MTVSNMLELLYTVQADIKKQVDATPQCHPNYQKARKHIISAHKRLKEIFS